MRLFGNVESFQSLAKEKDAITIGLIGTPDSPILGFVLHTTSERNQYSNRYINIRRV